MKPVYQTGLNCFAACIASILEVSLNDVPDFVGIHDDYYLDETNAWLEQHGYVMYFVVVTDDMKVCMGSNQHYILCGQCNGIGHAVVANLSGVVHDPRVDAENKPPIQPWITDDDKPHREFWTVHLINPKQHPINITKQVH